MPPKRRSHKTRCCNQDYDEATTHALHSLHTHIFDIQPTFLIKAIGYHLNNPGECRSEWYSDQPDYQSGLQMPQLFEKILLINLRALHRVRQKKADRQSG